MKLLQQKRQGRQPMCAGLTEERGQHHQQNPDPRTCSGNLCPSLDILHWSIDPEISDGGAGGGCGCGKWLLVVALTVVVVVDMMVGVLVRLVAVVVVFIDNKCWGALISARSTGPDDRRAAEWVM